MTNTTPSKPVNVNKELSNNDMPDLEKKPAKPPKIVDKPFDDFITNFFIPGLTQSIHDKGTNINEIKRMNEEWVRQTFEPNKALE